MVSQLDALISQLAAIPGVKAVGGSNGLPLSGDGSNGSFFAEQADFSAHPEPLGYAEFRVANAWDVYNACAQTSPTWFTRINAAAWRLSSGDNGPVDSVAEGLACFARGFANKVRRAQSAAFSSESMVNLRNLNSVTV
mgnify:CR=1 FL=1